MCISYYCVNARYSLLSGVDGHHTQVVTSSLLPKPHPLIRKCFSSPVFSTQSEAPPTPQYQHQSCIVNTRVPAYPIQGLLPLPGSKVCCVPSVEKGNPPHPGPLYGGGFPQATVIHHYPPYPPHPGCYQRGEVLYHRSPGKECGPPRYVSYQQLPYDYPVIGSPHSAPTIHPNELTYSQQDPLQRRPNSAIPILRPNVSKPMNMNSFVTNNMPVQSKPVCEAFPNQTTRGGQSVITHTTAVNTQRSSFKKPAVQPAQTVQPRTTSSSLGPVKPVVIPTKSVPVLMSGVKTSPSMETRPTVGIGRGATSGILPRKRISARSVGLGRGLSPGIPPERRPGARSSTLSSDNI